MYNTPILFLIFNRPECTEKVFHRIRETCPAKLYIAADGPRNSVTSDAENCRKTRNLVTEIDWPCEVHYLFRNENLGCRRAVSEAITWFFENEPEGIILEDDCFPTHTFFRFASQALERFRDDHTILSINGCSLGFENRASNEAFASRYMNMWGWATWRRSMLLVDYDMASWKKCRVPILKLAALLSLRPISTDLWWIIELAMRFERTALGQVNTWDFQWVWTGIQHKKTVVVPPLNLVRNLGFHEDATHTTIANEYLAELPLQESKEDLLIPEELQLIDDFETHYVRHRWFSMSPKGRKGHLNRAWHLSIRHLLQRQMVNTPP